VIFSVINLAANCEENFWFIRHESLLVNGLIISKAPWRSFLVDSWSSLMAHNSLAFKCDSTVMKKLWVLILINLTCW
jgi:hypothetical protein